MAPPTVQTLQRLAAETGYRLDTLEKVLRLLELLDEIAGDPVLSQRLALKGGTVLNVFYLDLDRLSVDIDLNYVGALDLAAMERERPEVDAANDRLFASHGYGVRRRPAGHAGGKWLARYASALGGNASLELDLSYMARQLSAPFRKCTKTAVVEVLVTSWHLLRYLFESLSSSPHDGLGQALRPPCARHFQTDRLPTISRRR